MTARKRRKAPRALLVYCEGKTEKAYFDILLDFYRLPAFVKVEVYGQKGQHAALVDKVAARRNELQGELGFAEDEVECWAVCDEDKMPCSYAELLKYAGDRGVELAFSAPQFEMFLIQHFEQSGDADKGVVFEKLTSYRNKYGYGGEYDEGSKSDLAWMNEAIDRQPKIVQTAITNSDIRNRAAKRPFLTVQELAKRIKALSL